MAMPQTITAGRHVYADGQFKRMLINGEWVKSASGKTFESRNPATGDLLATVAEGDAEDINRAVAAARAAFEGPWSKFKSYERQALLLKLADLVEKHFDHPRHARYGRPAYPHASHPSAGALVCRHGGVDPRRDHREFAAGRIFLLHPERADRSRWCDHPVERTAWRDGLEGRAGAGYRLHRRVEAGRGSAANLAQARRVDPRSRRPAGGRQYRAGQWRDRRGRTCGASRCR